jgi:Tetracyclin repressor-like, C-terminal domain
LKRYIDSSLQGYIQEGIVDGSIAFCNPKIAAFALAGAINWIGSWYSPEGELRPEEIASEFATLLSDGLRSWPGASSTAASRKRNLARELSVVQ